MLPTMLREISVNLNICFLNSHSFRTDLEMKTLSECNNLPYYCHPQCLSVFVSVREKRNKNAYPGSGVISPVNNLICL